MESIFDVTGCGVLMPADHPQQPCRQVPLGTTVLAVANQNEEDANTVVTNFYQIGGLSGWL